jgi:hypothetical protein
MVLHNIHIQDICVRDVIDNYMIPDGYGKSYAEIYIKEALEFFANPEYSHFMKEWLVYINKHYPQYNSKIEKYLVLI